MANTEAGNSLERARTLADLRRWQDALGALGPALASPDTAYQALCLQAFCLLHGGPGDESRRVAQARMALRTAVDVRPDGEWAYRLLATVLLREDRRAAALRSAEQAARLDPGGVLPLVSLARCQLSAGRHQRAQRTAKAAVAAGPRETAAYQILGEVASSIERWDEAEGAFRAGLSLDPQDEALVLSLAQVLLNQRRYVEATEAFLVAARMDPGGSAPVRALCQLENDMRRSHQEWRRQEPRSLEIRDAIAECGGSIAAAFEEFWAASHKSHGRVDELLSQAVDLIFTAARSYGTGLEKHYAPLLAPLRKAEPGSYRRARPTPDWSVLDLRENPLPGEPSRVASAAAALRKAGQEAAAISEQFAAVAAATSGLHVEGHDGVTFRGIAVQIHGALSGLARAYEACSSALLEFRDGLQLARSQVLTARGWAEKAISPQRAYVTPRTPEQEKSRQQTLRESEGERQAAIETVADALIEFSVAEAQSAGAIRAAIPSGYDGSEGVAR